MRRWRAPYYKTGNREQARALLLGNAGAAPLGSRIAADASDFATAEQLLASSPPTYQLALVRYRAGKYAASESVLRNLLAAGDQSGDVFSLLGWCSYKQGNFKEAIAAMDLAIDREPSKVANYLDLGMILLSYNRVPVALEAAKKAVQVAPNSYEAEMLKGLTEARSNLMDEAAGTYRSAGALRPDAPEALVALGVVLTAAGRAREAEETFRRGLERFPKSAVLHQEYGKFLAGEGKPDRADALLRRAVLLDPSLADAHFELGRLALEKNEPREALPHLEAAVRLKPRSSKMHFALSRAYRDADRPQDADRELGAFEEAKSAEKDVAFPAASRGGAPGLPEVPDPSAPTRSRI